MLKNSSISLLMLLCGPVVAGPLSFNRDVRPILSENCLACHGFDEKKRKGDLRLDTFEGATARNSEGRVAIVPGNPDASELWKRVISKDPDEMMPPPDSHKELKEPQRAILRQWIEEGAPYQKHWAFEPVAKPAPPAESGLTNPIDAFLLADLAKRGLKSAGEAPKEILIRRVAFALTGLPPSLAEVDAYLQDGSPDAFEKMVDRYLASPAYGEEMARHWLDVARYGDTHGLHLDNERHTWAYRDWVVGAFNENLSFDKFTIHQLAGDLLPEPTDDQLVATGFNRCNVTTSEGGAINEEWLFRYAVDRASTTAQTWLGLSAGCAVCHDHKYDPLSMKEFYSLYAFFYSNADPAMDGNATNTAPVMKVMTGDERAKVQALEPRRIEAEKNLAALVSQLNYEDPATQKAPPDKTPVEQVLFDDNFPDGAELQGAVTYAAKDKQAPLSGERSLVLSGNDVTQAFYEKGGQPIVVPQAGVFSFHVFLPADKPAQEVMVQFNTGAWSHRAAWGKDIIPWGEVGKPSRMMLGGRPEIGKWVRLEFPYEKLSLKPGTKLNGFALTITGGTAYFDKVVSTGEVNRAGDAAFSYKVWRQQQRDSKGKGLADPLRQIVRQAMEQDSPEETKMLKEYYLGRVCQSAEAQVGPARAALAALENEVRAIQDGAPVTFIYKDLPQPRQAHVMTRGQYDQPAEPVQPGVPAVFPTLKLPEGKTRADRLDLAKWLVQRDNPLTARVSVNRLWQQFFGTGLVKSSHDFGTQGTLPSHPELLDFLAAHFQDTGWNVRQLVRTMVTSAAFRRDSRITPALLEVDPENLLLARGPRFRLDAEQLRDNALAVSGLLVNQVGGKPVKPYQPPNIWEPVGFGGSNTRFYKADRGPALYRRSLYTFVKRTAPHPYMTNFDAPNREQSCSRRERSNTPLQALQLMNDVQHYEAARSLAQRMMVHGGTTAEQRIQFAYRTVLARLPRPEEVATVKALFDRQMASYAARPDDAKNAVAAGESKPDPSLPAPELASWTLVANLVLNLDETVTRN